MKDMRLSEEAIEKYKKIYKKKFRKEISNEEAQKQGVQLINLVRTVYKSSNIKKQQLKSS